MVVKESEHHVAGNMVLSLLDNQHGAGDLWATRPSQRSAPRMRARAMVQTVAKEAAAKEAVAKEEGLTAKAPVALIPDFARSWRLHRPQQSAMSTHSPWSRSTPSPVFKS